MSIRGYPWGSLDRVPRAVARGGRTARRRLADSLDLDGITRGLAELVGGGVELSARVSRTPPARDRFAEVTLACGATELGVGVAPDLATALLGRVLGRSFALARQDSNLDPVLLGALGALAVEVARRAARAPVVLAPRPIGEPALCVDVTARIDGRPYAAYVLVSDGATAGSDATPTLAELGGIEVSLALVIAVSLATRAELAELRPGSAWLPGAGAFTNSAGVGRGVLAAPTGERGVLVDLTADGRIVLRHGSVEIAPDEAISEQGDMAEANGDDTLTDAVLEAPVVVRVELGTVSMAASDWAKLAPGDVIETGQRIAEPVVLRIAGRAVARGELVDVEGELGVRIRELVREKS